MIVKSFALITAMMQEADHIVHTYNLTQTQKINHLTIYENDDIVLLCAGIGKIQAAIATTYLIKHYTFKTCINIGIAGNLRRNDVQIGDVFFINQLIQHDMDLPFEGEHLAYAKQPIWLKQHPVISDIDDCTVHYNGCCLTGDQFISDSKKLDGLRTQFGGDVVEMEAFAIASVLDLFGKLDTFVCIKAISDGADADAKHAHMDNLDFAMKNSIVVLQNIVG